MESGWRTIPGIPSFRNLLEGPSEPLCQNPENMFTGSTETPTGYQNETKEQKLQLAQDGAGGGARVVC